MSYTVIDPVRMLSKSEAAKLMGIGKNTLQNLIDSGKVGMIRTEQSYKISYGEILNFIKTYTQYFDRPNGSDILNPEIRNQIQTDSVEILNNIMEEM